MLSQSLTAKRIFLNAALSLMALLVFSAGVFASSQYPAERQRAIDLYEANNFKDALPLLEKVAAANPDDSVILSRLGFALYATSVTEKDPVLRHQLREHARETLVRSQSFGDKSPLTAMVLDALSAPDATQIPFSNIKTAEAAIREGEAAFVRGDMDQAIAAYKRALESDPHLYDAALYAGDAEFKKASNSTDPQFRGEHFDAAGVWFAKATAIDANRETAHRYWGDALDAQGKTEQARDRFVEAIIAEPYGRRAYVGLTQWAQRHQVNLGHPKIEPPNSTSTQGGKTTLSIDPKRLDTTDGSSNWLMYDLTRIAWSRGEFFKNYPNEKVYRHSLKEEVAAFRMVAEAAAKELKSGQIKKLEPSLAMLVKLNEDGFLEAYVLFAHPDEGIVRDYAAYRKDNREKLRRYWFEVVIVRG
jgi:tetratricopeptide (TPR) repeat protein